MKLNTILGLAVVSTGVLSGCSTTNQHASWPVFYDSEKGAVHLSISREPQAMDFYARGIPDWNQDLRIPAAKINAAEEKVLGQIDGLRVLQAHLTLADIYYTDTVMILKEPRPQWFLPVYVQNYNRSTRSPSTSIVSNEKGKLVLEPGMDYKGTGHFHSRYKIIISPDHAPIVIAP